MGISEVNRNKRDQQAAQTSSEFDFVHFGVFVVVSCCLQVMSAIIFNLVK
jgi:hypothetical protein